jgi:hypothetical protein
MGMILLTRLEMIQAEAAVPLMPSSRAPDGGEWKDAEAVDTALCRAQARKVLEAIEEYADEFDETEVAVTHVVPKAVRAEWRREAGLTE